MRKTLGIILIVFGLIAPLTIRAANTDFIKYITDEYPEYFDVTEVTFDEDRKMIIAQADIDNKISDKEGIESFNEGIAHIIFSDEIEQLDRLTDIIFIGYAEDDNGVEQSQAVVYYSWNDMGLIRAEGLLVEKDAYIFSTYYVINEQFSQYLEDFEEADPLKFYPETEEVVNSSIGISKNDPLPEIK